MLLNLLHLLTFNSPTCELNIRKIINSISEDTYKNLFKGSYNKSKKYIPKKSRKNFKKIINKSAF